MGERNPVRGTRLPDGLDERYTTYRDSNDMTDSEALRSLIRSGLEDEEPDEEPDTAAAGGGGGLLGRLTRSADQALGGALVVVLGLWFYELAATVPMAVFSGFLGLAVGFLVLGVIGHAVVEIVGRRAGEPSVWAGRCREGWLLWSRVTNGEVQA